MGAYVVSMTHGSLCRLCGTPPSTAPDWSYGNGPEVTGPAEALVMMMAGRLVALGDLSGEGKAALATRR
jgi:hypothetical protein